MASKAYVVAMTVSELKEELKQRGMSTKGSKKDLRDRLEQALYDEELDDPSSESESESGGHTFGRGVGTLSGFNFEVPPESFIAEEDLLPDDDDEDEDYAESMTVSIELSNKERLEVCPRASATARMAVGIGDRSMGDRSLDPMIVQIEIGNRQLVQQGSGIARGVADGESAHMDASTVEEHAAIVRKADAISRLSASAGINGGREPPVATLHAAARETAFEAPVVHPEPTVSDQHIQNTIDHVPADFETTQTDGIRPVEQIYTAETIGAEFKPTSRIKNDDNNFSKPEVTVSDEKPLEAPEISQTASSQIESLPTEHESSPLIESPAEIAQKIEETHTEHEPQSKRYIYPPTTTEVEPPVVEAPSNIATSPPPLQQQIDQPIATEPVSESTLPEGVDKTEHIQSPEPQKQETHPDISTENEQETSEESAPTMSMESTKVTQMAEPPLSDVAELQEVACENVIQDEMEVQTGEAEPSVVVDAEKEEHSSASVSVPEQENVLCDSEMKGKDDAMEVEDSAEGQPAQSKQLESHSEEMQPYRETVESSDVEKDTVSSAMMEHIPDETSSMQEAADIQEQALESAASIEAPTSPQLNQDPGETDTPFPAMERDTPQDIQELASSESKEIQETSKLQTPSEQESNDEVTQPPTEQETLEDTQDIAESAAGSLVPESSKGKYIHESKLSPSKPDQDMSEHSPAIETEQPEDVDIVQSTTQDLTSSYPQDQNVSDQPPAVESEQPPAVGSEQPPAVGSEQPPAVGSEQPPAVESEQPPAVGSEQPPAVGSEQPPLPDHTPSEKSPVPEQDVHETLTQDQDVPLPAETAEQLHIHNQTIPESSQEQEQPSDQEKTNNQDTVESAAAPFQDQDIPMESSPLQEQNNSVPSPPIQDQESPYITPEQTVSSETIAVQEEPSTDKLQQVVNYETNVVMKEQDADTPEETGPSEPQQVQLEQNTPIKEVEDTTADTVPSSKEMEQVSQTTLQIDDVLVHAEEDDLSVFSTEAAEADLVLTNLTSNQSQQQRSSGKGRSTHNVVHEQVGISSSSSRARKGSYEPSRLVSSSLNEKRSRHDKEEGHTEAPSVKRRRISTHAPGSSATSGAGNSQERKRRWGSAKQRSNSASTPTATISSDDLKDIIPADMEGIVIGDGGDVTGEGLDNDGGEEQVTRDEEEKVTGSSGGVGSAADLEWQEVEKERELKRKEVERARQELETRRRIEARLRAKQEADAKARRESTDKDKKRTPSPARNPKTRILHVENLTRPFTKMQLIELLTEDGPIIEDAYWTNKVKSHCIVVYKSESTAVATRQRLHGIKWPSTNPKRLNVDFLTADRVAVITEGQLVVDEITEGEEEVHEVQTEEDETMDTAEEEAIEGKDKDAAMPSPSLQTQAADSNEVKVNDKSDEGTAQAEQPVAEEPKKSTKLLDELFKKTKATPSIYWLPLTDAQVAEREAEERAREEERERQREERIRLRREEREKEDKERERRLQAERERRARERMRRRRSRSHSRSRSRSRNRSRSRSRDRDRKR